MADPSAASNNTPSNRPQYFCHICQREIEPLMVPNPTCPICTNDFVEEIDAANDPREFAGVMGTDHELDLDHDADDEFDDMNMPSGGTPGSPDVAHMLQSLLQQVFGPNFRVETRTMPPGQGADGSATTTTTATITTDGATVTTGTYTAGPSQTGDGNEQQQGQQGRPNVFVSMGGANNAAEGDNIGSPTPLFTITQILQRAFGDNTQGNNTTANLMNLFQMVGDPRDYAWGPGGLDQIITQLLEQQAARTAPPPAPDDIINNLPRAKITKKQVVEEQLNCPVCKEDYNEGEEVVTLPCNHAFHDDCIKPWLKMNGTCPVCRYSLVKQEPEGSDQHNDDGSQNGHNTNANANSNLPSSSSVGGGWFLPGSYPTQQQDGRRNDDSANHDILDPESMD